MKFVKDFLSILMNLGVDPNASRMRQKEIVLSNRISLFLFPITIAGFVLCYSSENYFTLIGFSAFILFLCCVFLLNKFGKSRTARIGLSILPSLFLLMPIVINGIGKADSYLAYSYTFIGLTIIPLFLFHSKKDYSILSIILCFQLFIILFFDVFIEWSMVGKLDFQLFEENYIYFKLPQFMLWAFLVTAFQFLKIENAQFEQNLEKSNNSLKESNNKIKTRNAEIIEQNEVLNESKLRIEEQNNKLTNTNIEFDKTIAALEDTKEKLIRQEVEAKSMLSALNKHYLIAQLDMSGNLVNINTRAIELLGEVRNEFFQHIKPIYDQNVTKHDETPYENNFTHVLEKIKNGESVTIKLDIKNDDKIICLATTFTTLFDLNNQPYEILVIGQDITELIDESSIDKINEELKEKISEISQKNKMLNFQQKEIFDKSEKLIEQKEEIQSINETLELRVKDRTSVLEAKNKQLTEYAFINSHVLRSPVSTLMGLINLISYSSLTKDDQKMYEYLKVTAQELDDVVIKINVAIDSRMHFDRNLFNKDK